MIRLTKEFYDRNEGGAYTKEKSIHVQTGVSCMALHSSLEVLEVGTDDAKKGGSMASLLATPNVCLRMSNAFDRPNCQHECFMTI